MPRPSWSTIFVFAVIAVMLVAINARPAFPDPDSFYHAKMALVIRDQGFIHAFPWLQETTWRENYVDGHLLYHVLLIPFVTLFDPLVGMKVSAIAFGLLAFYAIYRFLRSIESPYPEWLTLAAAFSFDFLHRMSMPRAPSLSVAFLIFGIWAMLKSRHKTLFAATVAFVWLYQGWPVLVAALGCVVAGELVARRVAPGRTDFSIWKTCLAVAGGIVVGHVANPYFSENVSAIIPIIVQIGVVGGSDISVGSEWSKPKWWKTILANMLAVTALFASVALVFSARRFRGLGLLVTGVRAAVSTGFLALFFLIFLFKSIRYVEYLVPSVLIASGAMLAIARPYLDRQVVQLRTDMAGTFQTIRSRPWLIATGILFGLAVMTLLIVRGVKLSTNGVGAYSRERYQGSADWLGQNLARESVVFNSVWDSSMIYFYLNDAAYFLVGLDPRLMYDRDQDRYKAWFDLKVSPNPDLEKITGLFRASAVLIDRRIPSPLGEAIDASGLFDRPYEDEWVQIFVPKPSL